MREAKINEIMNNVEQAWIQEYGKENIDYSKLELVRGGLKSCPHEDGLMPCTLLGGKTHLVPIEYIILNGLEGKDIDLFPLQGEAESK